MITKRLASVFSHCYSFSPVPPVPPMDITLSTQLGNISLLSCDHLLISICNKHLKDHALVSVLRYSFSEQPGDVRCDVHGGRASVLCSPGAADVGF